MAAMLPTAAEPSPARIPTKVDRSAAYAARYLARNVVAAGIADRCTIQIAYAIGVADPMSLLVDTHGTGKVEEKKLEKALPKSSGSPPQYPPHRSSTGRSTGARLPTAISAAPRTRTAASPGKDRPGEGHQKRRRLIYPRRVHPAFVTSEGMDPLTSVTRTRDRGRLRHGGPDRKVARVFRPAQRPSITAAAGVSIQTLLLRLAIDLTALPPPPASLFPIWSTRPVFERMLQATPASRWRYRVSWSKMCTRQPLRPETGHGNMLRLWGKSRNKAVALPELTSCKSTHCSATRIASSSSAQLMIVLQSENTSSSSKST